MSGLSPFTCGVGRYDDNVLATGRSFGSPERDLDCAAGLRIGDPPES